MSFDEQLRHLVDEALNEDIGDGDHSTLSCIDTGAKGKAILKIKQGGILAGMEVAEKIFSYIEPSSIFTPFKKDGDEMKYGEKAFEKKENHIAAIESDAGGFLPLGFGLNMPQDKKNKVIAWRSLFIPYGMYNFDGDGDGADISPMTKKGVPGIGLEVNSQRYFDYHHAGSDTFDKVNRREMEMGAAAMAGLIYLLSEYGL